MFIGYRLDSKDYKSKIGDQILFKSPIIVKHKNRDVYVGYILEENSVHYFLDMFKKIREGIKPTLDKYGVIGADDSAEIFIVDILDQNDNKTNIDIEK